MNLQEAVMQFVRAIQNKKMVQIRFYSKEDGVTIERTCAPMDFGPSRRARLKNDRFHVWDIDSDEKPHILSLPPEQIVDIVVLDNEFNPSNIVNWDTNRTPWFVERDWGDVS
ncbi:hypothetical protein [Desulfosporosinus sp. I2]|uniref:hypothetical protein n=1 Tax=Desulfosporosinus sp. I2 TaxID=1617025 RepID=UPI0005EDA68A|nr:hypothetical protein [Desulfosporosinus sp. I2]